MSLAHKNILALPIFHTLEGCDIAFAFINHGKKTALAKWEGFLTKDALLTPVLCLSEIRIEALNTMQ